MSNADSDVQILDDDGNPIDVSPPDNPVVALPARTARTNQFPGKLNFTKDENRGMRLHIYEMVHAGNLFNVAYGQNGTVWNELYDSLFIGTYDDDGMGW